MKVFVVDGSMAYYQLFASLGFELAVNQDDAELIVFTGGADVTPALYGDKAHVSTGNSVYRDRSEQQVFTKALRKGIPMVGICRGGQFLNVMSGGRMYQHVGNHGGGHYITDLETGETVYVSSTHHQMMMPSDKAIIVATAQLGGFREWYDGDIFRRDISKEDIEVVFYPETKCLCFQPHPEFSDSDWEGMKAYFSRCLDKYLLRKDETVHSI